MVMRLNDLEAEFHRRREDLRAAVVRGPVTGAVFEFIAFGIKQAWACLFAGLMLALLLAVFFVYPETAPLHRFDVITLGAIAIQTGMILARLESWAEVRIIAVFHLVGTVMELFKVHVGSWIYPGAEEALFAIAGVPLFSGFMYASVGSYMARVWRIFDFRFDRFPPVWIQAALAIAAYLNFYTHHYVIDIRWGLFAVSALIYGPCLIWFRPDRQHRFMPLLLGLLLVALFIWFAENIGTYARAWAYPDQEAGWRMVSLSKLGSWYLLMLISFVLVVMLREREAISSQS